jgi:lysophospholipase L1-like esterase
MLDERKRRLVRNLAIALVLAACSAAQYVAVSKAATLRTDDVHPTAAGYEPMGQRDNVSRASNR